MTGTGAIAVGQILEGKYRVLGELGAGSMGIVYAAVHQTLHRKLAVKTLRREIATDADVVQRFQQEARTAGSLGHANIVQIFDAGCTPNGEHYIVMEHLDGHSLEDELLQTPVTAPERAARIMLQVLSGLAAAHKRGIVHRDLKPANIFVARVEEGEVVKLVDFGISKILQSADPMLAKGQGTSGTRAGCIIGTPLYMSPEQASGKAIDHRTDIWAVGAVLYEMLCGVPPFNYDHPAQVLTAIMQGSFAPPRQLRPSIPPALEAFILQAMQQNPAARFQDARSMANALRAAMSGSGVAVPGAIASGTGETYLPPTQGPPPAPLAPAQTAPAAGQSILDVAPRTAEQDAADEKMIAALSRISAPVDVAGDEVTDDGTNDASGARFAPTFEEDEERPLELDHRELDGAVYSELKGANTPPGHRQRLKQGHRVSERLAATRLHRRARTRSIIGAVFLLALLAAGGAYVYRYTKLGYWGLNPPPKLTATIHFELSPVDAEILRNGIPVTERPLRVRVGDDFEFSFRAPGRLTVVRHVQAVRQDSTRIAIRLPSAIAALDPDTQYSSDTDRAVRTFDDANALETAQKRLALLEECVHGLARPISDSRDVFLRSAPRRMGPGKLPAALPLPADAISKCATNIRLAEEYKPEIPALSKAAVSYNEAVQQLAPSVENLKRYIDSKGYQRDNYQIGTRMLPIVRADFKRAWKAQTTFVQLVQNERLALQMFELEAQEGLEGQTLHWHLRAMVIASQELAIALSIPKARRHQKRARKAFQNALNGARDHALAHEAEVKRTKGAQPLLNAASAMLDAEPGKGVFWHNQSVELFNALELR